MISSSDGTVCVPAHDDMENLSRNSGSDFTGDIRVARYGKRLPSEAVERMRALGYLPK
jgi:hypothetical protein